MNPILYRTILFLDLIFVFHASVDAQNKSLWNPDNGDGTYTNPVVYADYSDPDVIRVDNDYFLVSSSFHETPGLPILHSTDLVNWTIIGHAIDTLAHVIFSTPQQGKGVWAPSIRFHNGKFFVYYGDPDFGIYVVTTNDVFGKWEIPILVKEGKGLIDPCPFWDDDGKAYLVHAWAKSRAGFNSILTVHAMNSEGTRLLDEGKIVFDGHEHHPTIEGSKFYKRNGYYYIFAPAGGVKTGWQTVLKGNSPVGPFEDRIVMEQGATQINGPHQGAWIEDVSGDSWFIHFQDKGAYGRIVHLQPVKWEKDWPIIGDKVIGKNSGEPVFTSRKPGSKFKSEISIPQTSDEFSSTILGKQWQWNANYKKNWYSLTERKGFLRLFGIRESDSADNVWSVPNILVQKFPSEAFTATIKVDVSELQQGLRFGFFILGLDYSAFDLEREGKEVKINKTICLEAMQKTKEKIEEEVSVQSSQVFLRISVLSDARCSYQYSTDGVAFQNIGDHFQAKPGLWIGARIGLYCISDSNSSSKGFVDIEWVQIE